MGFLNKVKDLAQKGAEKGVDLGKKSIEKGTELGVKGYIRVPRNLQKRVTTRQRKNRFQTITSV